MHPGRNGGIPIKRLASAPLTQRLGTHSIVLPPARAQPRAHGQVRCRDSGIKAGGRTRPAVSQAQLFPRHERGASTERICNNTLLDVLHTTAAFAPLSSLLFSGILCFYFPSDHTWSSGLSCTARTLLFIYHTWPAGSSTNSMRNDRYPASSSGDR